MRPIIFTLAAGALLLTWQTAAAQPRFHLDYHYEVQPGVYEAGYTLDNSNGTVACSDVSGEFEYRYGGVIDAGGPNGWTYHYEYGHPYWSTDDSETWVQAGDGLTGFWMQVTRPELVVGPVKYSTGPQHDEFWEGVTHWLGAIKGVVASDPEGDVALSCMDLAQLNADVDGENLILTITIIGDISVTTTRKYIISIDTDQVVGSGGMSEFPDADPPTNNANPWVRNIAIVTSDYLAEYFLGSWVDWGGGMQLWQFTGSGSPQWQQMTGNYTMEMLPGPISTIKYTIPLSDLGVGPGDTLYMEAYSSGQYSYDSAIDTVNDPYDDWVWTGDWQAEATVQNSTYYAIPTPGPEFVYLGCEEISPGLYQHNYKLSNLNGSVDIYDVDIEFLYQYGWLYVDGPGDWEYQHYFPGPMSAFVTDSAPVMVDDELEGFYIQAASPWVQVGDVTFTDVTHTPIGASTTSWPYTPGPVLVYMGYQEEAPGDYRHDYVLTNFTLEGEPLLYDVELPEYRYGWFSITGPDDWNLVTEMGGAFWRTEAAPCNIDQELYGYSIHAGTPGVQYGEVSYTDIDHVVVATGQTSWPKLGPGGDTCASATVVPEPLPYSNSGTTVGYANDYDETCPYAGGTAPDAVYSFTPTTNTTVDISLCTNSAYDTKLYVYEGVCQVPGDGNSPYACNDDICSTPSYPSPYVSKVTGVPLTGGITYYIIVDGYGTASGSYTIDVTEVVSAACCMPDGSCLNIGPLACTAGGGEAHGSGTVCLGDLNGDGLDDACYEPPCDDCGPGVHWVDTCQSGFDQMPSQAVVAIDTNLDPNCLPDVSLTLTGPVFATRSSPMDDSAYYPGTRPVDGHFDVIDTEILSMNLVGGGATLSAGSPTGITPTRGVVAEQTTDLRLADSFFDVFFQVDLGGGMVLYNQTAARMTTVLNCVPPDATFVLQGNCIPLYDSPTPGQGTHLANLVYAKHDLYPAEAKWSQRPHPSEEGFDAASDLWWSETKWFQPPDPNFSGLHCHDWYTDNYYWITLADDWLCEGGDVTDLHWWGSYEFVGSGIDHFHLSIHSTTYGPQGWFVPMEPPLWQTDAPFSSVHETDTGMVGAFGSIYSYHFDLPEPFAQQPFEYYWLDISAHSVNPINGNGWHWQEAGRGYSFEGHAPAAESLSGNPWDTLWGGEQFSDMAFAITSRDLTLQEPDKVVADDFVSDGRPIQAIRWWGSYLDPQYAPGVVGCYAPKEKCTGAHNSALHTVAYVLAQSFSPQEDYTLCKVSVLLADYEACAMTLYVQDGPDPNDIIYTQGTTTTLGTGRDEWYEFDVTDYGLVRDQLYFIRVKGYEPPPPTPPCSNLWNRYQQAGGGPYHRGNAYVNGQPMADIDHLFITYTDGPNTGPHVMDGWFLSFHHDQTLNPGCPPDLLLGDPHPTVLGVYFAPVEAVNILPLDMTDCLGHLLYKYEVDLTQCCLLCSQLDPRPQANPPEPAQMGVFLETRGLYYWLDIQAVTGVTWQPPGCSYGDRIVTGHLPSPLTADGDFWGWHTSPGPVTPCDPRYSACTGRIADFTAYPPDCWDYGGWDVTNWLCPTPPPPQGVQTAFELLTNEPDPCGTCLGDLNGDGSVDGLDIQLFVECILNAALPWSQCACADFDGSKAIDMSDVDAFVQKLLTAGPVYYGWEDGGTVLGLAGTGTPPIIVTNVNTPTHSGTHSLRLEDNSPSGTPQAYVAWITGLKEGDLVQAGFWRYDTTPSASPSCRIWAHYTEDPNDINSSAGSAGGNTDYGPGTGWDETAWTWLFDSAGGTQDGLVIEARTYSNPGDTVWVDDIWIKAPCNATITVP